MRFASLRLLTQNVTATRDWYAQLFELEPIEDTLNFCSFRIGDVAFDIVLCDFKNPFSTGGAVGYWQVQDFEFFLNRAQEMGATIYRGPLRVEEIGRSIVQIKDPIGNIMGFEG